MTTNSQNLCCVYAKQTIKILQIVRKPNRKVKMEQSHQYYRYNNLLFELNEETNHHINCTRISVAEIKNCNVHLVCFIQVPLLLLFKTVI